MRRGRPRPCQREAALQLAGQARANPRYLISNHGQLQSPVAFWTLGITVQLLSLSLVLLIIHRAGWMRLFHGDDA